MLLRATDAGGRQVCCVYKRGSGPRHATVYGDEGLRRVRFLIEDDAPDRRRFLEDLKSSRTPLKDLTRPDLAGYETSGRLPGAPGQVIRGPDGSRLGVLADPAGAWEVIWRGAYDLTDAAGRRVARIFRENPLRPPRCVELRGSTVLRLRRRAHSKDGYRLEKVADMPAEEEELLLAGVVATTLNDWWRDPEA